MLVRGHAVNEQSGSERSFAMGMSRGGERQGGHMTPLVFVPSDQVPSPRVPGDSGRPRRELQREPFFTPGCIIDAETIYESLNGN